MWRFIADLSAVINTEWAEKKIKTVPHSVKSIDTIDTMKTRTILRTILRTISEQLYPKLLNNEPRPKFTGSHKRACISGAYAGGVHWVHVHLPTWEKSSSQKCPKEERKFRPDMSA